MLPDLEALEALVSTLRRDCSSLSPEDAAPVLLAASPSNRAARLQSLNTVRSRTDAYLTRVLKLREDITTAAQLLASYKARLDHATSPISALPAEVLVMILDILYPTGVEHTEELCDPRPLIQLSHVCSRWRALLLSDSKKWAVVPISSSTPEDMLLEYARRAGDRLLTLKVADENPDATRDDPIRIPPLVAQMTDSVMLTRSEQLNWLHFPSLEAELWQLRLGPLVSPTGSIDFDMSNFTFNNSTSEQLYYRSAESLSCFMVGLFRPASNIRIPFPRLHRLNFFGQTADGLLDTLDSIDAPSLSSIYIANLFVPPSSFANPYSAPRRFERITPQLRHLDLTGDKETFAVISQFLRGITAPELEKLELSLWPRVTDTRYSSADTTPIIVRIPVPTCMSEKDEY